MTDKSGGKAAALKKTFGQFRQYWSHPAPGRFVPYSEYVSVFWAVGGEYALARILGLLSFSSGCWLVMFYYEIPVLTFSVIGTFFVIQGYFWSIVGMIIGDNLGFLPKKTERLFYILYSIFAVLGVLFFIFDFSEIIPFPDSLTSYLTSFPGMNLRAALKIFAAHWFTVGWGGIRGIFIRKKWLPKLGRFKWATYTNVLPAILFILLICWLPIYQRPLTERVWMLYALFAFYGMYGFNGAAGSISDNISPDPHERMLVRCYPVKLSHIFNSVINDMIFPVVAAYTGGMTNINTFRYIIPVMTIMMAVLYYSSLGKIQERIPQPPPEKKKYIPFWSGVSGVMKNKYLWINAVSGLIDALGNGGLAVRDIVLIYTWREQGIIFVIVKNLISFVGNPGAFLAPWIRKRFQYKTLVIFKRTIFTFQSAGYILACTVFAGNYFLSGLIMLITLLIGDMLSSAIKLAEADMTERINDYQMYLSGERLGGFQGIIGWFTGPFASLISLIIPVLFYRVGFSSDYDILFVDDIRSKCMVIGAAFDLVGHILCIIPFLFWDFTDEKHAHVIEVLKERERASMQEGASEAEIYDV